MPKDHQKPSVVKPSGDIKKVDLDFNADGEGTFGIVGKVRSATKHPKMYKYMKDVSEKARPDIEWGLAASRVLWDSGTSLLTTTPQNPVYTMKRRGDLAKSANESNLFHLLYHGKLDNDFATRVAVIVQLLKKGKRAPDAGVLHADLKPGNIMVDTNTLEVDIVDFDSMHPMGSPAYSVTTTRGYRNPQQYYDLFFTQDPTVKGKLALLSATDLHSMAVIIQELLGDRKAYELQAYGDTNLFAKIDAGETPQLEDFLMVLSALDRTQLFNGIKNVPTEYKEEIINLLNKVLAQPLINSDLAKPKISVLHDWKDAIVTNPKTGASQPLMTDGQKELVSLVHRAYEEHNVESLIPPSMGEVLNLFLKIQFELDPDKALRQQNDQFTAVKSTWMAIQAWMGENNPLIQQDIDENIKDIEKLLAATPPTAKSYVEADNLINDNQFKINNYARWIKKLTKLEGFIDQNIKAYEDHKQDTRVPILKEYKKFIKDSKQRFPADPAEFIPFEQEHNTLARYNADFAKILKKTLKAQAKAVAASRAVDTHRTEKSTATTTGISGRDALRRAAAQKQALQKAKEEREAATKGKEKLPETIKKLPPARPQGRK